jgi:branched-chain amino acid transport system ATP-binding protein
VSLQITGLSAWYGQARALYDVNLNVRPGEVVGILGHNGAGKTTLLRAITGLHEKQQGDVSLDGQSLRGLGTHQRALMGLSLLREGGQLPESLSVLDNLALGQRLAGKRGRSGRALEDVWNWFPILEPIKHRPAGLLSGGQRQALALATTFIAEPSFILLDEPSAGLAPPVAAELFALIKRLAQTGTPILIVEQHPGWLRGLADRIYLLEVGTFIAEGTIEEIIGKNSEED